METGMKRIAFSVAMLVAPMLACAQQQDDASVKVQGGPLPAGWTVRLDDKETGRTVNDTRFVAMGSGYHVTSGPAAIYYSPANQVTGPFSASARFRQTKAPTHPEAYGLVFGGPSLDA